MLFVTVCSILFMTSLTAFAAHTDGTTKVIAHIETSPTETTQPVTDDSSSSVSNNDGGILTGDIIFVSVIISCILLLVSGLVILLCNKNHRRIGKPSNHS